MSNSLGKIVKFILDSQRVLLITHENPDGDALGSMLGLSAALKLLGKSVDTVCVSEIPRPFLFLPSREKITRDFLLGDYDLIVILDCGDLRRTGFSHRLKQFSIHKKRIINVDHHPKNDLHKLARFNLVDYNASSTSEIIYRLIKQMSLEMDSLIATCLLCGIYTDTGAFQHSNTNPEVMKIASDLLAQGARLKDITKNITNGKTVAALKLWGLALSRVWKNEGLGIVTSVITRKDLVYCGAAQTDLAGVVNMISSIPDSRVALLLYELQEGYIKASLRTERNDIDVSRLAQVFGGGGLKKASGFTIKGKIVKNIDGWGIK